MHKKIDLICWISWWCFGIRNKKRMLFRKSKNVQKTRRWQQPWEWMIFFEVYNKLLASFLAFFANCKKDKNSYCRAASTWNKIFAVFTERTKKSSSLAHLSNMTSDWTCRVRYLHILITIFHRVCFHIESKAIFQLSKRSRWSSRSDWRERFITCHLNNDNKMA